MHAYGLKPNHSDHLKAKLGDHLQTEAALGKAGPPLAKDKDNSLKMDKDKTKSGPAVKKEAVKKEKEKAAPALKKEKDKGAPTTKKEKDKAAPGLKKEGKAALQKGDQDPLLPCRYGTSCRKLYASISRERTFLPRGGSGSCGFYHTQNEADQVRGLVKSESLQTVEASPQRRTEAVRQQEEAEDDKLCLICLAQPKTMGVVHQSSVHLVGCADCVATLATCPLCRAQIEKVVRVY